MAEQAKPKVLVIQGPTACGKTALSIRLAQEYQGEIVNADSMQMVRGFNVGTAKPTPQERQQVPHHLFDVVSPDEHYDAGGYVDRARAVIDLILRKQRLPIIVGGTGLYVRTLLGGLADLPGADAQLRERYQAILNEQGVKALADMLLEKDPKAVQTLDLENPVRVIRALEVLELTGEPIWLHQQRHEFADRPYDTLQVVIHADLAVLDDRIRQRTALMVKSGLIEEVQRLLMVYGDRTLRPYQSIGYRQVLEFLDGKTDYYNLEEEIIRKTRRYARKQLQWLRNEKQTRWYRYPEQEHGLTQDVGSWLAGEALPAVEDGLPSSE